MPSSPPPPRAKPFRPAHLRGVWAAQREGTPLAACERLQRVAGQPGGERCPTNGSTVARSSARVYGWPGAEDRRGRRPLDHHSGVHHHDALASRRHEIEVVRDEDDTQVPPATKFVEEVEDLGGERDVEGRRRLVGEQHLGSPARARARSARWRIPPLNSCGNRPPGRAVAEARRPPSPAKPAGAAPRPTARGRWRRKRLFDLPADGERRVEGRQRVLEDEGDVAPPHPAKRLACHWAIGLPSNRISPVILARGSTRPRIASRDSVLPLPDSPTTPTISPARTLNEHVPVPTGRDRGSAPSDRAPREADTVGRFGRRPLARPSRSVIGGARRGRGSRRARRRGSSSRRRTARSPEPGKMARWAATAKYDWLSASSRPHDVVRRLHAHAEIADGGLAEDRVAHHARQQHEHREVGIGQHVAQQDARRSTRPIARAAVT